MAIIHASPGAMVYARALFEAADRQGGDALLTTVGDRLDDMGQAWLADRTWRAYFLSAIVPSSTKQQSMARLVGSSDAPALLGNLLKVLLRRNRLALLAEIAVGFRTLLDERLGRIPVTFTTAVPVAETDFRAWTETIRTIIGGEPVVEHVVDPDIVAGVIIRVGDHVLDASARKSLAELRQGIIRRGKQSHALQS